MDGGSMLRSAGRAAGAAVGSGGGGGMKDVLSAAVGARPVKPASLVSVTSSSPSSPPSFAASATVRSNPYLRDWEERGPTGGVSDRLPFGPVPSKEEAEEAVSTLQRIFVPVTFSKVFGDGFPSLDMNAIDCKLLASTELMERVSSAEPEMYSNKPSQQLHGSKPIQYEGQAKVFDAFRLLQFNPSVQRMVVSISSDKAVWDAVMKNEVVQEFQKSFHAGRSSRSQSSSGCIDDIAASILRWILENTKAKIMELVGKITELVNDLLHSQEREKKMDLFDDVVRSSFMLSVMVFIIVIVTRLQ